MTEKHIYSPYNNGNESIFQEASTQMAPSFIPLWMLSEDEYAPETDHDGFIRKSLMKLMGLLEQIRENPAVSGKGPGAAMKLIAVLYLIILDALSANMFFTYCVLAGLLTVLALLPGKSLARVIRSALSMMVLSMLILLPAVFLGSPRTMLTVSLKVFVSVGLIGLMNVTTPWNQITQALKMFHLPDLFIFTLDITLKFIAILGQICQDMLTALKLRSVGRNKRKGHALSGILGVTFLKSRAMAEEMYSAMECRGFEGTYVTRRKRLFGRRDIPLAVLCAAALAGYIYLG